MRVRREQLPVGQGCFATGTIDARNVTNNETRLHYVYDCGARNRACLREVISNYKDGAGRLDALFVSHFDDDHVSGLDLLLANVSAKTVYIPYIDNVAPVLEVIESM